MQKTCLDQGEYEEIAWTKKMILQNGDNKPKLVNFSKQEQKALYNYYNAVRGINVI